MKNRILVLSILLIPIVLLLFNACQTEERLFTVEYPDKSLTLIPEKAKQLSEQIRDEVSVTMPEGLELTLWASDSLLADPIAISVDQQGGIYYTQGNRIENSEFDIRGHRDWMTQSISWQTVEERRQFIRNTFTDDSEQAKQHLVDLNDDGVLNWKDLTVEKEEIWRVSDESGDGIADYAKLYLQDFNTEISDLANGVEFHDGDVYVAVGPDLWKTRDVDGDGIADNVESLAHGFAVHIGFGAHGMSGVTTGPDGRIWWGIGDIGMNLVDKDGKRWKYPNQGVIVRCEPDGSNFEVFSAGHRNTHEFVFDKYGNLITEDNDGDHAGERERLVYIVNGSDSGWRINWQFGKYTDPDNNSYKVWMDEKMSVPRWDGQAAYIIPPITNYVNGPTGMVYNPGTALGPEWYDHFFIAEFRGTPAQSPIHAFTLKPDGAGFALDKTTEFVKGLLPTGIDIGPDGALYFGDWIDGWGAKSLGRLWKLDSKDDKNSELRQQIKALIQSDFTILEDSELATHLSSQDMRIRLKAQFELAKRGDSGYTSLLNTAKSNQNQLARIHGLWGMGQFARKDKTKGTDFVQFLSDTDVEIVAQAAKQIGDFRYTGASTKLISLVNNDNPRIRFFATEALGRIVDKDASDEIIKMLETNDDEDVYLRHVGSLALSRIGDEDKISALFNHSSRSLRIAAVVALRRMQSPQVAKFLNDQDEYIVTEAARAINDDWSIEPALPALANVLNEERFTNEALIRRSINANLRLGGDDNLNNLVEYVKRANAPEEMRAEAIASLSTWAKPSVLDRVDGRYRGEITREKDSAIKALEPIIDQLLSDGNNSVVIEASKAVSKLGIHKAESVIYDLVNNGSKADIRSQAIASLLAINSNRKSEALSIALKDKSKRVRSKALELIPESDLDDDSAVTLFKGILSNGTIEEKQATYAALASIKSASAVSLLATSLDDLTSGNIESGIALDVIESVRSQNNDALVSELDEYLKKRNPGNPLAMYKETLEGGDAVKGRRIFYQNQAAQCVRCHSVFEWGGDAGPGLQGLASRMSKEDILESLIDPSAKISKGYAVGSFKLNNDESVAGVISNETDEFVEIKIAEDKSRRINKTEIKEREDIPSSMPGIKDILSLVEIRDLMAYLSSLKQFES